MYHSLTFLFKNHKKVEITELSMMIKLNRQKKPKTLNTTKQRDKGQRGAEDIHSKN